MVSKTDFKVGGRVAITEDPYWLLNDEKGWHSHQDASDERPRPKIGDKGVVAAVREDGQLGVRLDRGDTTSWTIAAACLESLTTLAEAAPAEPEVQVIRADEARLRRWDPVMQLWLEADLTKARHDDWVLDVVDAETGQKLKVHVRNQRNGASWLRGEGE